MKRNVKTRTPKNGKSARPVGRGGRWISFFRLRTLGVVAVFLSMGAMVLLGLRLYRAGERLFPVREVVFYGNLHLSEAELKTMMGLNPEEGLIHASAKRISERLLKSPWIRNVSVRKEFPHLMEMKIDESSPFAILEMKGRSFLIDEKGKLLEEMKGTIPFLPVITADPFGDRQEFLEALHLARVLKDRKVATERSRVEIVTGKGPESIAMVLDGVLIKIGEGDYEQKLNRLFELEDEIKRRAIAVDYVDLRFANRVVVKPISEVVR
ncbi:MAG TPA: FtsQ-type POTRA domain-containing protein [Thermodesulfovibrionales bacterium]|nr:FtsQ-type POTRA domain-containing protein [Thermodesulfovibrionales bacterium]